MKKIKEILKKVLTKEIMLYIVFGVFTTVVNLGSFYVMNNLLHWNENISNFVAILLAVLFAYITNKDLVFHSDAEGIKEKFKEFVRFMVGRAFTMVVEFAGGWILFKTAIPVMISKCFVTIVVIILNFYSSHYFKLFY